MIYLSPNPNSLSTNVALHKTYLPVDKGAVDAVDQARIKGRRRNSSINHVKEQ
jgi:hypothetical protein